MNSYYLIAQLVVFLLLTLLFSLCIFYLRKIASIKLRYSSNFCISSFMGYNALLSLVRLPHLDYETAHVLSHLVFFLGHLLLLTAFLFAIVFLKIPKEVRTVRFRFVVSGLTFLMCLSLFPGYMEAGLVQIEGQYRPIPGSWRPFSHILYIISLIYMSYLYMHSYKQATDDFTQKQIALMGLTFIFSFVSSILFNSLIPTYLGTSHYNILSQVCYVLLAYVFFYLNTQYKNLYVERILRRMLKLPSFRNSLNNTITLQQLLQTLSTTLSMSKNTHPQKTPKLLERFQFELDLGPKTKPKQKIFFLSTEAPQASPKEESISTYFPIGSYLEALNRLERENLSIGLNLQRAHEMLHECVSLKKLSEYEETRNNIESTLYLTHPKNNLSPLEHSEKREILKSLTKNHYDKLATAKELRITLNTIKSKIKKYNIELKPLPTKALPLLSNHKDS